MRYLYAGEVGAGFPSPGERWRERSLDVNDLIRLHPDATFFMLVRGESMKNLNVFDGDLVVVDRAVEATHGNIIIAVVNGGFTIKQLHIHSDGGIELASAIRGFPRSSLRRRSRLGSGGSSSSFFGASTPLLGSVPGSTAFYGETTHSSKYRWASVRAHGYCCFDATVI